MKTIALSKGQFAIVDDGDFEWLSSSKWAALEVKRKAGTVFYAFRHPKWKGPIHYMHRDIGDHRDGNGLNNQRHNLRSCTATQNNGNRKKGVGWSSRFKGVHWVKSLQKWRVQLKHKNKVYCLGNYDVEEDAAKAYDTAARTHFGEFACTNFP